MDTVLLVVTVLSVAAALGSLTAMLRWKRADQHRSDERVAALAAAAGESAGQGWSQNVGEWQWNPPAKPALRDERPREDAGRELAATPSQKARLTQDTSVVTSDNLFGTVRREAPASGAFALVAGAALIVALGGAIAVFTTSGHAKAVAQVAPPGPLELVSLGHSREASLLTITGIVRNPPTGPKLEGLTAVVSLIDGHGGLISTKDVPLDYRALGPGEEAPFKITVPDPGSVARYRVSFRAGTDVVPHVDRRSDTKLASAL